MTTFVLSNLTSAICACGAIYMWKTQPHVEGWGWLLFVAVITATGGK